MKGITNNYKNWIQISTFFKHKKSFILLWVIEQNGGSWGCCSVVEHMLNLCEALESIPNTTKEKEIEKEQIWVVLKQIGYVIEMNKITAALKDKFNIRDKN